MASPTKPSTGKGSKKITRKVAIKRADTWFSKYIRQRDGNQSVLSGPSDKQMNCGHVIGRQYFVLRWDERNAFCITAGENWAHEMNPHPFNNWVMATHGQQYIADLWREANEPHDKPTTEEILAIAEHWKKRYQELLDEEDTE